MTSFLKYKKIRVLGIFLLVIAVCAWGFYRLVHPPIDPDCFARDEVLVKINGTVLAVPREYHPIFHAPEGKKIPYADKLSMLNVCQKENDPPLDVRDIWIPDEGMHGMAHTNLSTYSPSSTDAYKSFSIDRFYVSFQHHSKKDYELKLYEDEIKQELELWNKRANFILESQKIGN